MDAREIAAELRALADRIKHLPAYDHRRPHSFHEGKAALAADVVALAEVITARRDPPPAPMPLMLAPSRRRPFVLTFRKVSRP